MIKKILVFILVVFVSLTSYAQEETETSISPLTFSGFVDFYYLYDLNQPSTNDRSPYAFAYHRHNEMNLNLGFLKGAYDNGKYFANLALQTGTYARANYAAEPPELRMIQEANVGIRFNDKLTLDAGLFGSHIGVESAVNQGCYNLTRSLMADGSPYFETGARLSYTPNEKWLFSGLVLNGWQNIYDNNDNKAVGAQITFSPNETFSFNYSNFYGNEQPKGTPARFRFFHDFYIVANDIFPGFSATAVFDYMTQENATGGNDVMFSPALLLYYRAEKIGVGGRVEHYNDANEIINATGTPNGFQVSSASVNLDLYLKENVMWRFEARGYDSQDAILLSNAAPSNSGAIIATSISMVF